MLLLDEPSAALDPRQRERLWEYLGGLSRDGTTVVFATHTLSEAERHADRMLVLADGETLFWGPPRSSGSVVAGRRATSSRPSSSSCDEQGH